MSFSRYARLGAPRSAFPGVRRKPPGNAPLAASSADSKFVNLYVPASLWPAEIATFGSPADYWPNGDVAQSVSINLIWKDGAADEEVSPGRYSHALVRNADLPAPPKSGDVVLRDGLPYNVVRVVAYTYEICTVVLQEAE